MTVFASNLLDDELAGIIHQWHAENGGHGGSSPAPHVLRALNEFVELCLAAGCTGEEVMGRVFDECIRQAKKGNVGGAFKAVSFAEEYGDVRVSLEIIRHYSKIDERVAILATMLKNRGRKFEADTAGVLWRPGHSM